MIVLQATWRPTTNCPRPSGTAAGVRKGNERESGQMDTLQDNDVGFWPFPWGLWTLVRALASDRAWVL